MTSSPWVFGFSHLCHDAHGQLGLWNVVVDHFLISADMRRPLADQYIVLPDGLWYHFAKGREELPYGNAVRIAVVGVDVFKVWMSWGRVHGC